MQLSSMRRRRLRNNGSPEVSRIGKNLTVKIFKAAAPVLL